MGCESEIFKERLNEDYRDDPASDNNDTSGSVVADNNNSSISVWVILIVVTVISNIKFLAYLIAKAIIAKRKLQTNKFIGSSCMAYMSCSIFYCCFFLALWVFGLWGVFTSIGINFLRMVGSLLLVIEPFLLFIVTIITVIISTSKCCRRNIYVQETEGANIEINDDNANNDDDNKNADDNDEDNDTNDNDDDDDNEASIYGTEENDIEMPRL